MYLQSIAISVKQEAVESEIISLLGNGEIQSVVIKGNQIAGEIYGDPNCRISSDIDILIRKADAVKADAILSEAGYIAEEGMPLVYCLARIHHAAYRHPVNNMLIELHWGFGVPYFFSLGPEEIWRGVVVTDSGRAMLSPEMMLVMLLIHHHSHAFRELKILVDILWAFYKYEKIIDWQMFAMKIKKTGLLKSTQITLHQLQMFRQEAVHELKSVRTLEREMKHMGQKTPRFLVSYFRIDDGEVSNLYKDKLVARCALDKWTTMLFSYFRTLLPVPQALKELYHDQRNWHLPFHYLRFMSWRVRDWMRG
jgi:hypothetical protein